MVVNNTASTCKVFRSSCVIERRNTNQVDWNYHGTYPATSCNVLQANLSLKKNRGKYPVVLEIYIDIISKKE